jgi:hypothetical protein
MARDGDDEEDAWQLPGKVKEFAWKVNQYFEGNQDDSAAVHAVFGRKS